VFICRDAASGMEGVRRARGVNAAARDPFALAAAVLILDWRRGGPSWRRSRGSWQALAGAPPDKLPRRPPRPPRAMPEARLRNEAWAVLSTRVLFALVEGSLD